MINRPIVISLLVIVVMAIYIFLNPSYQKSIQAKYYFEMGEYSEALILANEAFSLDVYNRMSATVKAQSITALKYVSYINDSKKYMSQINQIAKQDVISDADKAKIKIICEIMIGSYIKLAPSVITDKELVKKSADYFSNFEKLLDKVNK